MFDQPALRANAHPPSPQRRSLVLGAHGPRYLHVLVVEART